MKSELSVVDVGEFGLIARLAKLLPAVPGVVGVGDFEGGGDACFVSFFREIVATFGQHNLLSCGFDGGLGIFDGE